jgi:hypothetical protein
MIVIYPHKKEPRGFKSGERAGQESNFTYDTNPAVDNCRVVIETLHSCTVMEHIRVETTLEDAYWRTHRPSADLSVYQGY